LSKLNVFNELGHKIGKIYGAVVLVRSFCTLLLVEPRVTVVLDEIPEVLDLCEILLYFIVYTLRVIVNVNQKGIFLLYVAVVYL
jgi:hypothetical protein